MIQKGESTTGNPYLELAETIKAMASSSTSSTTPDDYCCLDEYGMGKDVFDCPVCGNTGRIVREDEDGVVWVRECDCMNARRAIRRLRRSGLEDAVSRYTFAAYETPDDKRRAVLNAAKRFCKQDSGWFYIAGQSGSGKTHICTAICGELLKTVDVRYMLWREDAPRLKAAANEPEYGELIEPLKRVPVLYIDDFLKGKTTDADFNLAFELINARYNDSRLRTIISSELPINAILNLDEGLGGRIYERSRGFMVQPPDENWRLRR